MANWWSACRIPVRTPRLWTVSFYREKRFLSLIEPSEAKKLRSIYKFFEVEFFTNTSAKFDFFINTICFLTLLYKRRESRVCKGCEFFRDRVLQKAAQNTCLSLVLDELCENNWCSTIFVDSATTGTHSGPHTIHIRHRFFLKYTRTTRFASKPPQFSLQRSQWCDGSIGLQNFRLLFKLDCCFPILLTICNKEKQTFRTLNLLYLTPTDQFQFWFRMKMSKTKNVEVGQLLENLNNRSDTDCTLKFLLLKDMSAINWCLPDYEYQKRDLSPYPKVCTQHFAHITPKNKRLKEFAWFEKDVWRMDIVFN